MSSLVPRPHPSAREKGLVTIARFLVCADSAVLNSCKPIRLQVLDLSCDKHTIACTCAAHGVLDDTSQLSQGWKNMAHGRHNGHLKLVQICTQETRYLRKIHEHRH